MTTIQSIIESAWENRALLSEEKTVETITELTEQDPQSKKIYSAFLEFQKKIIPWTQITEKPFYSKMI